MAAQRFFVGQTLIFKATFRDATGELTTPQAANVRLKQYRRAVETLPMAPVGPENGEWRASWNSGTKPPGVVKWDVRSTLVPTIAKSGRFTLRANSATA